MKIYKAPVILWKDSLGNWYGRHVEPFGFLNKDDCVFVQNMKSVLLKEMKISLQQKLNEFQKKDHFLDPVKEREYLWTTVSFSVRASQGYKTGRFPELRNTQLASPLVWRIDESEIVHVLLPLENVEFTTFQHEPFHELAKEALRRWYADRSQREILLRAKIQEVVMETLTISLEREKESDEEAEIVTGFLGKLAIPISRSFRRKNFIPPYGREKESKTLSTLLEKKMNLILCGPTGCGKTTLLVDAALNAQQNVNSEENDKSSVFWWTNVRHMISGTTWLGEWQQQFANLFKELNEHKAVLCLENLAELLNRGTSPYDSFAAFFIPFLEDHKISVVGEATPETLRALGRALPSFVEQFQIHDVVPLNEDSAASAMLDFSKTYEIGKQNFYVETNVPSTVVQLYRRFFSGSVFPGPAFSFLRKSLLTAYRKKVKVYDQEHVYQDFLRETGLPERLFRDEQTLNRQEVETALEKGVVGQPEAIHATASAVLRFKAALNHPKKPIASFLFCGPTGVGKTQLVRTLAEYLFGSGHTENRHHTSETVRRRFLRLDMSEYQFYGAAEQMIERPDGSSGPLIEHIRREPFSVILFDEIEKAARDTFDLLLNLLDEGRLTDRIGRTFDFRNTIIVMTSNLGTSTKRVGGFIDSDSDKQIIDSCQKAVLDFFRPEFVNRIDELVVFHQLDRTTCRKIVAMEIDALKNREGTQVRNLRFTASSELIDLLVQHGFHAAYGARPLRREIEKNIVPVLARFLAQKKITDATLMFGLSKDGDVQLSVKSNVPK